MVKKQVFYVYVFRHGETTFNRDRVFTGWLNPRLTKKGNKDAELIAKKLKSKKIDIAISSSLTRSRQTLKKVLQYHPECKKIIEDDRIIERNYGVYSGMSHRDFIIKYGEKKFNEVHRGWKVHIKDGENFSQVEIRVKEFVDYLKKYIKENKKNIAISAHGNSIRLLRRVIEKLPIKETREITIPYDRIYEYKIIIDGNKVEIEYEK